MRPGIWNIVIGAVMVAGGMSGRFVLWGTGSGMALAAFGAAVAIFGVYQFTRAGRN